MKNKGIKNIINIEEVNQDYIKEGDYLADVPSIDSVSEIFQVISITESKGDIKNEIELEIIWSLDSEKIGNKINIETRKNTNLFKVIFKENLKGKNKRSIFTEGFINHLNEELSGKYKFKNSSWHNDETDSAEDEKLDVRVYFPYPGENEFRHFVIYPDYSKGDNDKYIIVDTLDDVINELNKLNIKENNMVQDNEIIVGTKIVFKDKAGKAIMNEWLDLSGQTGEVVDVLFSSGGRLKEVFIKLDKYDNILDEWENKVIFSSPDEIDELLNMIEIVKNEPLTNEEQINWLNDFIVRWDKFMDTPKEDGFGQEGVLMSEYEQFLMNNNLPSLSADELLRIIQRLNNLKGLVVIVEDNITNERFIAKIRDIRIQEDGKYVYVFTDEGKDYVSDVDNIMNLTEGLNAHGQDVLFKPAKDETEEEKTAFNNLDKFIEEYKDYLIGKYVTNEKGDKFRLNNISDMEAGTKLKETAIIYLGNGTDKYFRIHLKIEDFQSFIDGDEIKDDGYKESYSLLLQVEPENEIMEEKINQSDYKYYIVNTKTRKIQSGWEYKEDADDNLKELIEFGQKDMSVHSKKSIKSLDIDPDDNSNWGSSKDNYSIIKEALDFGVTEGDYDQADADKYLSVYESSGKYISVIKARLVYYLEHADKHFKQAILNSQYEKALRFLETKSKISEELLKIIKKDI